MSKYAHNFILPVLWIVTYTFFSDFEELVFTAPHAYIEHLKNAFLFIFLIEIYALIIWRIENVLFLLVLNGLENMGGDMEKNRHWKL